MLIIHFHSTFETQCGIDSVFQILPAGLNFFLHLNYESYLLHKNVLLCVRVLYPKHTSRNFLNSPSIGLHLFCLLYKLKIKQKYPPTMTGDSPTWGFCVSLIRIIVHFLLFEHPLLVTLELGIIPLVDLLYQGSLTTCPEIKKNSHDKNVL